MKITQLRAHQPDTPGAPPDWRTQLGQIVVEVETESGEVGIGVGGGGAASIHIIDTVLSELLVGRDASAVEQLHGEMLQHTVMYGRSGLVVMANSGVDLALWDLRGKTRDCSVARLLNPEVDLNRPLPTYATVFDDVDGEQAIRFGHRAIKLHVERFGDRPDPSAIRDLVQQVRGRLGSRAMVMIDAFARWDFASSLKIVEALADLDVAWLEEPLPPDDLDGYAALAAQSPVPIAGGEHEYTAAGFRKLIDGKLHHILQPDINWCGGLTTLVEIYDMARMHGLRVCPHRGSEPFAVQAIAALDPDPLAESPRTWFTCLAGAPQIEAGSIHCTAAPGFGVRLAG